MFQKSFENVFKKVSKKFQKRFSKVAAAATKLRRPVPCAFVIWKFIVSEKKF